MKLHLPRCNSIFRANKPCCEYVNHVLCGGKLSDFSIDMISKCEFFIMGEFPKFDKKLFYKFCYKLSQY